MSSFQGRRCSGRHAQIIARPPAGGPREVDNRHTLSYNEECRPRITASTPRKTPGSPASGGSPSKQIIALIEGGKLLRVLEHPNKARYPDQMLYEVDVDGYVHIVPVLGKDGTLFLKTIYPSRKATRARSEGERP